MDETDLLKAALGTVSGDGVLTIADKSTSFYSIVITTDILDNFRYHWLGAPAATGMEEVDMSSPNEAIGINFNKDHSSSEAS